MAPEVEFSLDDGASLRFDDDELGRVYDALWDLAGKRGAVTTAVLLMESWRLHPSVKKPVALTARQSTVLREAVALIHAD